MKSSLYSLLYIHLSNEFNCAALVKLYLETPDASASLILDVSISTSFARKDFMLSKPTFHVPGNVSKAPIDLTKSSAERLSLSFIKFVAECIKGFDR